MNETLGLPSRRQYVIMVKSTHGEVREESIPYSDTHLCP